MIEWPGVPAQYIKILCMCMHAVVNMCGACAGLLYVFVKETLLPYANIIAVW